jgi:hypothetical protein
VAEVTISAVFELSPGCAALAAINAAVAKCIARVGSAEISDSFTGDAGATRRDVAVQVAV